MLLIYGTKKTSIGLEEFFIKCPSCEVHSWADVMIISNYWHFYFVPMWPVGKEANVICQHCGLKRYGINFDSGLINNFDEIKSRFRHRWFEYAGLAIILSPVAAAALVSLFRHGSHQ
jgi:hypothetical protein